MRTLHLVMVGDELLDGRVAETNSHWLLARAARRGWSVSGVETVGDGLDDLVGAIARAASLAHHVLVAGGLGPTPDDRTREALARWAGEELVLDPVALADIEALFAARGRVMSPSNRRQAMRPASSCCLRNPTGTAPGLWHPTPRGSVIVLPGVPAELRAMFEIAVEERLAREATADAWPSARLRTARVPESTLSDLVEPVVAAVGGIDLSFCVSDHGVDVVLRHRDRAALERATAAVRTELGARVYDEAGRSLAEAAVDALGAAGLDVATAESCTGGLLGAALTSVPGSSRVYLGGVIAYDDAVKVRTLGIGPELLRSHGAVSEPVATAMAVAVRARTGARIGVATTGIAGPGGGSEDKPVGTVWVAVADDRGASARRLRLGGDRETVRRWTVATLLDVLRRVAAGDAAFAER